MAIKFNLGIWKSFTCKIFNQTILKRSFSISQLHQHRQIPSPYDESRNIYRKRHQKQKKKIQNQAIQHPEHDLKDDSVFDKSKTHLCDMEKVTLFYKPSGTVFSVNPKFKDPDASLFICSNRNILNFTFNQNEDVEKELKYDKDNKLKTVKDLMWQPINTHWKKLPHIYFRLAKRDLSGLVVVTAVAGYAMAPGAFDLSILIGTIIGTGLCSTSANTINQILEVPYDSQMNRTKNRVLVKKEISSLHAVTFALLTGVTGTLSLYCLANSLTAFLGFSTILLYTSLYTPMKRIHISNTWIGAIVGAIPPMMGWTASSGCLEIGAIWLAAILYAWQFPHFNALSWNLREDYAKAGYRMMAVLNPNLNKLVALRYSLCLVGLCVAAPILDITTWAFAIDSLPANVYLSYLAWKFYCNGDSNSSRKLFRFSLIHLPLIVMLMLISKKSYGFSKQKTDDLSSEKIIQTE